MTKKIFLIIIVLLIEVSILPSIYGNTERNNVIPDVLVKEKKSFIYSKNKIWGDTPSDISRDIEWDKIFRYETYKDNLKRYVFAKENLKLFQSMLPNYWCKEVIRDLLNNCINSTTKHLEQLDREIGEYVGLSNKRLEQYRDASRRDNQGTDRGNTLPDRINWFGPTNMGTTPQTGNHNSGADIDW